jgi:hypothetical protein
MLYGIFSPLFPAALTKFGKVPSHGLSLFLDGNLQKFNRRLSERKPVFLAKIAYLVPQLRRNS